MIDTDYYYTAEKYAESEIKIKGSKFLAYLFKVHSAEEASQKLEEIRKINYDANHNCFAYIIGESGDDFRYSDDGEPSGSAGKPIYMAIQKYKLSDILVVVTRYFGGTKLGVGGLVRAYGDSAESALKIVQKQKVHITRKISVNCKYEDVSLLKRLIDEFAVSFTENYTDSVRFEINLYRSKSDEFSGKLFDSSHGRLETNTILDYEKLYGI
jgi:uncharacterized YigZ family protein